MESLKSDNEHLLALLRDTAEYADLDDAQIVKGVSRAKTKLNNDWIPTDAVRAILTIKDEFKG